MPLRHKAAVTGIVALPLLAGLGASPVPATSGAQPALVGRQAAQLPLAPEDRAPGTGIRITVSDSGGRKGSVTVTGNGLTRVISRTTTLRGLKPGTYRIKAASIIHPGIGRRDPVLKDNVIRVRKGHITSTEVSYAAVIRSQTRLVQPSQVVAVKRLTSASNGRQPTYLVKLRRAGFRPGTVLVSGKAPKAPHGFHLKVLGSMGSKGGVATYRARQAEIAEVLKEGRIETSWFRKRGTKRVGTSDTLWSGNTTFNESQGCFSGSASVSGNVTAAADLDLSASWKTGQPLSVTVSGSASLDAQAQLSGNLAVDCTMAQRAIGSQYKFTGFWVWTGHIPWYISPRMQFYVAGNLDIAESVGIGGSAKVATGFSATETVGKGLSTTYQPPTATWNLSDPAFTITGSAGVVVGPRFAFLVDDLVGASAEVMLGPVVSVTNTSPATWTVDGNVQAFIGSSGAGPFAKLGKFNKQILSKDFQIYRHP